MVLKLGAPGLGVEVLHEPPAAIGELAAVLGTHQDVGRLGSLGGVEQFEEITLAIGDADHPGAVEARLQLAGPAVAVEPLAGLLVVESPGVVAQAAQAVVFALAGPRLDIEQAQRRALDAECHGVVDEQALGAVGMRANGAVGRGGTVRPHSATHGVRRRLERLHSGQLGLIDAAHVVHRAAHG